MELDKWWKSELDTLCLHACWFLEAVNAVDPVSCFGSFLEGSPAVVAFGVEAAWLR